MQELRDNSTKLSSVSENPSPCNRIYPWLGGWDRVELATTGSDAALGKISD